MSEYRKLVNDATKKEKGKSQAKNHEVAELFADLCDRFFAECGTDLKTYRLMLANGRRRANRKRS